MRLLVPLDVRGCGDAVVERALWLANKAGDARIDLMTVIPELPTSVVGTGTLVVGQRAHALGAVLDEETAALLRGFAVLVDKSGVLGDVIARHGPVTDAILAVCEATRPEMIVMGSHARTGFARAVFGSVAESVLRRAGCPVLIVPAGRGLSEHPSDVALQVEAERAG